MSKAMEGSNIMETDRFALLEQRLAQVEVELEMSHMRIEQLRQSASRSRHKGRVTSALAACAFVAVLGITAGTASAAPGPKQLTVKTPFEVQNQAGRVIFRVAEQSGDGSGIAKVYDVDGKTLVALQTNESGGSGEVAVNGSKPGQIARLSSYGGDLGLRFYVGDNEQANFGTSAAGGQMQLNNSAGKLMAKIGNNGTSGTVGIYNADGITKGLLGTDTKQGYGEFDLFYADGTTPAIQLSEVSAGGYIGLTNRAGIARVQAGILPGDIGILRTYGPGGFDFVRGMK